MVGALTIRSAALRRASNPRPEATPLRIMWSLLVIGATSFGRAPSPYMIKEFVERRGWLSADEFAEGYALARLLPGPTGSNMVVYLGQSLSCGLVAALGLLPYAAPGVAVMLAASAFLLGNAWPAWFQGALLGASSAAIGLFVVAVVQMLPAARKSRGWLPVALASFVASAALQCNIVVVLLVCGGAAVWLNRRRS